MDITALITQLDSQNLFDAIDAQPDQLRLNFADSMRDDATAEWGIGIQNVVVAGMGGSALAPDLLKTWLAHRLLVPVEIVRGYDLPGYVDTRSLVVISSYSGNTEEALAALDDAHKRNAPVVVMAAAGDLVARAQQKNHMLMELPYVSQPRFSTFAGLRALACLLGDMGLIASVDVRRELLDVAHELDVIKTAFNLDITSEKNRALSIAQEMGNQTTLIYAGPSLAAVAYKWKINVNESAKQLAFCNVWPELNHNEMQGWLFPHDKPLSLIVLKNAFEFERVQRRMEVTQEVLRDYGYQPIEVTIPGSTPLAALLAAVLIGDYVSAFRGILNGVDPTPVELIERFKKQLG